MHKVRRHVWWTADRTRLVADGHSEAAFLAYAPGTEVADAEAARVGLAAVDGKSAPRLADKMAPRPADKSRKPIEQLKEIGP